MFDMSPDDQELRQILFNEDKENQQPNKRIDDSKNLKNHDQQV